MSDMKELLTACARLSGQGIGQKGRWFGLLGPAYNAPFKSIFTVHVIVSRFCEAIFSLRKIFGKSNQEIAS